MDLKKYLEKIQSDEAVGGFAIDSFPDGPKKKKKRQVIRTIYPNENTTSDEKYSRAMIDFDGTIHRYSKGFHDGSIYDKPFEGAKEAIDWLKNQGYEIVIFTARASQQSAEEQGWNHKQQIENVETWLTDNEIYYDRVTAEKLAADFYIDDLAITIKDGDWKTVLGIIKKKKIQ